MKNNKRRFSWNVTGASDYKYGVSVCECFSSRQSASIIVYLPVELETKLSRGRWRWRRWCPGWGWRATSDRGNTAPLQVWWCTPAEPRPPSAGGRSPSPRPGWSGSGGNEAPCQAGRGTTAFFRRWLQSNPDRASGRGLRFQDLRCRSCTLRWCEAGRTAEPRTAQTNSAILWSCCLQRNTACRCRGRLQTEASVTCPHTPAKGRPLSCKSKCWLYWAELSGRHILLVNWTWSTRTWISCYQSDLWGSPACCTHIFEWTADVRVRSCPTHRCYRDLHPAIWHLTLKTSHRTVLLPSVRWNRPEQSVSM